MVFMIVDTVAKVKISSTVATKCEKARKKVKQAEAAVIRENIEEKKAETKRE